MPRIEDKRPVWVVARQATLRDRVAAVSNRTGVITNGQRVMVIEEGKRFLRIRTEKNEIGWVEERAVIDEKSYQAFQQMDSDHAHDPVVARATLRDALYMHLLPGRDTDKFYLLPDNTKLDLLERASVEKPAPPGGVGPVRRSASVAQQKAIDEKAAAEAAEALKKGKAVKAPAVAAAPADSAPPKEDWWLVRDQQGHCGWIIAHRLDAELPQEIAGYSEGARIVGAYGLQTVIDPDMDTPDHKIIEYVTVEAPYKDGLPYDFDQIRIFTWNMKRHRYETALRQRNVKGYLPVTIEGGANPQFTVKLSTDGVVKTDPKTGVSTPVSYIPFKFELDGAVVRKVTNAPLPVFKNPEEEAKKEAAAKAKAKKKR